MYESARKAAKQRRVKNVISQWGLSILEHKKVIMKRTANAVSPSRKNVLYNAECYQQIGVACLVTQ
jgi:hypothetical protein